MATKGIRPTKVAVVKPPKPFEPGDKVVARHPDGSRIVLTVEWVNDGSGTVQLGRTDAPQLVMGAPLAMWERAGWTVTRKGRS